MAEIMNLDIDGTLARSRRFKKEWLKSVSANSADIKSFDADRLRSYIASLRAYIKFYQVQPPMDVPEFHGSRFIDVGPLPETPKVENEAVNDMSSLWDVFEIELINSASARSAFSLNEHDERRALALLDRMERLLEDYMVKILPLDLPESSPMQAAVTDGDLGIKRA